MNHELKKRLNNVGQKDWIKFSEKKGLLVVYGNNGSHYVNVRDPKYPDSIDPRGLITTLTPNCFKQANEKIFKRFLNFGIEEDEIWKGIGLM